MQCIVWSSWVRVRGYKRWKLMLSAEDMRSTDLERACGPHLISREMIDLLVESSIPWWAARYWCLILVRWLSPDRSVSPIGATRFSIAVLAHPLWLWPRSFFEMFNSQTHPLECVCYDVSHPTKTRWNSPTRIGAWILDEASAWAAEKSYKICCIHVKQSYTPLRDSRWLLGPFTTC